MAEQAAKELVTIVDSDNNVIGAITRKEMRAKKIPHRATYVFVFGQGEGEGEGAGARTGTDLYSDDADEQFLYVQKRTMTKDFCPGFFDPAAGGIVQAGESYALSAQRELEEEMGIVRHNIIYPENETNEKNNTDSYTSKYDSLYHLFMFKYVDGDVIVWGDAWKCYYNGSIDDLKPQPEEVQSVHLMSVSDILTQANTRKNFTPDGIYVLKMYLEMKKNRK